MVLFKLSPRIAMPVRQKVLKDDWDTKSCYSVNSEYPDDDASNISSIVHRLQVTSEYEASIVSNMDTLSFHTDPILTPQDLLDMGEGSLVSEYNKHSDYVPAKEVYTKRRGKAS
jgi:hypothetical protein